MDKIWLLEIIVNGPNDELLADDCMPFTTEQKALDFLPILVNECSGETILGMKIEGFWLYCHMTDDPYELADSERNYIFNADGTLRHKYEGVKSNDRTAT